MRTPFHILRTTRHEALPALAAMLLVAAAQAMLLYRYLPLVSCVPPAAWKPFLDAWQVSGFDPTGYLILTSWESVYNVYRHPLLMWMSFPAYLINQLCFLLFGQNCAPFVICALLLCCAFYSYIFLYRTLTQVVGVGHADGVLLSLLLFSFAHVLLSLVVPDHFAYSQLLLLLAVYVAGRRMRSGRPMKIWQTALYFLLAAGVTLTNGVKIFICALFVNGRRVLAWRWLAGAAVLPAAVLWGMATWEHTAFEVPRQQRLAQAAQERENRFVERLHRRFNDTTAIADSARREFVFAQQMKAREQRKASRERRKGYVAHRGKPMAEKGFASWTDISTPRGQTVVENLAGEGFQLHAGFLLQDVLRTRPVIVAYDHWWNYAAEALLVLLFLLGIVAGWRSRFLWLVLSLAGFDMLLHLGLGFGLNEVYIMTAHWAFVVPIAAAHTLRSRRRWWRWLLRLSAAALLLFLLVWNVRLMASAFLFA